MLQFERPKPELGTEDEVVRKRILAALVDFVGLWLVLGLLTDVATRISATLGGLMASLGIVVSFAYFIYFEAEYGQTVGKMAMDVVVVTETGDPITYREAAIRTLLRIVDVLPAFYIVGLVAMFVTDRKQRLGDLVADTVVVRSLEKGEKL